VKGLIHIYCGDGKGKTTAATGLAVRAAGTGMQVLFARFLKNETSGELNILDGIPQIEVIHMEKSYGFYQSLSDREKEEMTAMYRRLWDEVEQRAGSGQYGMLVLDELMAAYNYGILLNDRVHRFLETKPEKLEIVMTGRNPSEELMEYADYISEIKKIKHPFVIKASIIAKSGGTSDHAVPINIELSICNVPSLLSFFFCFSAALLPRHPFSPTFRHKKVYLFIILIHFCILVNVPQFHCKTLRFRLYNFLPFMFQAPHGFLSSILPRSAVLPDVHSCRLLWLLECPLRKHPPSWPVSEYFVHLSVVIF